ncbi:MAG: hypothetical protein R3F48_13215 [Candidatus Zixiibacteriota bacterium]
MRPLKQLYVLLLVSLFTLVGAAAAETVSPITGQRFDSLINAQHVDLQRHLEMIFPEDSGFFVTGPLDPFFDGPKDAEQLYHSVRIVCPSLDFLESCLSRLDADPKITVDRSAEYLHQCRLDFPVGFRGLLVFIDWSGKRYLLECNTWQQTRWLIWVKGILEGKDNTIEMMPLEAYSREVSDYLYHMDRGWDDIRLKKSTEFGLFDTLDFYRDPPDYVISGYQNYKIFLADHAAIHTDYAKGLLAFVPSDSLRAAIISHAPKAAFPNKEYRKLQEEMLEFFARGGDMSILHTLTAEVFDTLPAGEYFFGVGLTGKVRFGREMLREEVAQIEAETGRKAPRANHAFLFPGEPLLTAGAFFIERDSLPRIVEITAGSGHYFYSNVCKTIREDVTERSDYYFQTLGRFFKALDSLGIDYSGAMIRKL